MLNENYREGDMDLEEFKEYVLKQRRSQHDQRTSTENDKIEQRDVGTDQQDERIHRTDQG